MEIGTWIAITVISAAISWLLRPKLPSQAGAALAEFGERVQTEVYRGKAVPLVYGRLRLAATLFYFGAKRATSMDDQGRDMTRYEYNEALWDHADEIQGVAGWRYSATALLGVCLSPDATSVKIKKILCEGRVIWSGSVTDGSVSPILIGTTRDVVFKYTDVNVDDTINSSSHGSFTGDSFILIRDSGALPTGTGIANGTQLFVIRVSDDEMKWATTRDNAVANTAINITNVGTGQHRMQFGDRRTITAFTAGADNKVSSPGHGMLTGHGPFRLQAVTGALAAPLQARRDYWAIRTSADDFRVALSYGEALRGEYIVFSNTGSAGVRLVWTQPDVSQFFGGPLRGGGLRGAIYWLPGTTTQNAPLPLKNAVDLDAIYNPDYDSNTVPAFRDCAGALFTGYPWRFPTSIDRGASTGFDFGESGRIPEFTFEVESVPKNLDVWDDMPGGDANPVEVLYDLMVHDYSRLRYPAADVNGGSFTDAAETLITEGHGMSLVLGDKQEAERVVQQILAEIDAVLYEDQATGKIVLKLIRDDYDVGSLESYGPDDVVGEPDFGKPLWGLSFTQASLRFRDRYNEYTPDVAVWQDGSGGNLRSHTVSFPFVTDPDVAQALAQRSGLSRRRPLAAVRLPLSRRAAQHNPGDRIIWVWPDATVTQMVLVVHEVDKGEYDNGIVWVTVTQDRFRSAYVGKYPRPKPPPAVSAGGSYTEVFPSGQDVAMEAPAFYGNRTGMQNPDVAMLLYLPSTDQQQVATAETSEDGVAFEVDRAFMPPVPLGELEDILPLAGSSFQVGSLIAPDGDAAWKLFRSACADLVERDAVNLWLLGNPEGDHEFVAFTSGSYDPSTAVGTANSVIRGLLDTPQRSWPAGTPARAVGAMGSKLLGRKRLTCAPGDLTEVVVKMRPDTGYGASDAAAVGTRTVPLVGRASLPLPPAGFTLQQRVTWNATPSGAADLKDVTQESNPGINGSNVLHMGDDGAEDRVGLLVENEVYSVFNRRSKTSARLLSPSSADEAPSVTTAYRHEVRGDTGDGYVEADTVDQGGEWIGLDVFGYSDEDLDGGIRCFAEEASPAQDSMFAAEVPVEMFRGRQLFYNPSWQDDDGGSGSRAWATVTGTPAFTSDGPGGTRCFSGGASTPKIRQTRWVGFQGPGSTTMVRVTWLQRRSGDAEKVHVRVVNRIDGSDGAFVIDNDAVPASADYWERVTVIAEEDPGPGLDTDTDELRADVEVNNGTDALVTGLDVRLDVFQDLFDAGILVNPSFNTDETGWSTVSGTWARDTTEPFEGAGCEKVTADGQKRQTSSVLDADFKDEGDVWWFSVKVRCDGDDEVGAVLCEVLNSGAAVIASRYIDSIGATADYQSREVYLKLPAGADKVRVTFEGVNIGGGAYALFDDCQSCIFKGTGA